MNSSVRQRCGAVRPCAVVASVAKGKKRGRWEGTDDPIVAKGASIVVRSSQSKAAH